MNKLAGPFSPYTQPNGARPHVSASVGPERQEQPPSVAFELSLIFRMILPINLTREEEQERWREVMAEWHLSDDDGRRKLENERAVLPYDRERQERYLVAAAMSARPEPLSGGDRRGERTRRRHSSGAAAMAGSP